MVPDRPTKLPRHPDSVPEERRGGDDAELAAALPDGVSPEDIPRPETRTEPQTRLAEVRAAHNVVAAFDGLESARAAVLELEQASVPADAIALLGTRPDPTGGAEEAVEADAWHQSFFAVEDGNVAVGVHSDDTAIADRGYEVLAALDPLAINRFDD